MASGTSETSSFANSAQSLRVCRRPSDSRRAMFWPTVQPNCCRPCANAVRRACPSVSSALDGGEHADPRHPRRLLRTRHQRRRRHATETCDKFPTPHAAPTFRRGSAYTVRSRALKGSRELLSALGQKQTFAVQNGMSALPPIADMGADSVENVRFVPISHIGVLIRSTSAAGKFMHSRWRLCLQSLTSHVPFSMCSFHLTECSRRLDLSVHGPFR